MQTQHINLYTHFPKPIKPILSAQNALAAWLIWLCFLFIIYGYHYGILNRLSHISQSLAQQEQRAKMELQSIVKKFSGIDRNENHVEKLLSEINEKKDVLENIHKRRAQQALPHYLTLLATDVPPELWLTTIEFDLLKNRLLLKGKALAADQIPQLIDKLRQRKEFSSKDLQVLSLEKIAAAKVPVWQFNIGTEGSKQGEDSYAANSALPTTENVQ